MFWSHKSGTALCVFHLSACFPVIASVPDNGWDFQSHAALTRLLCHQIQLKCWKFCLPFYFCLSQERGILESEGKGSTTGLRKTIRDLCVLPHLASQRKIGAFKCCSGVNSSSESVIVAMCVSFSISGRNWSSILWMKNLHFNLYKCQLF